MKLCPVCSDSAAEAAHLSSHRVAGNHAGAVALAAKLRGIKAHIIIPRGAPQCKVGATQSYGGKRAAAPCKLCQEPCTHKLLNTVCWKRARYRRQVVQGSLARSRRGVLPAPGEVTLCEPTIDAREAATAEIQRATGAVFIPPYNAKATIAGQGTIALELLDQVRMLFWSVSWAALRGRADSYGLFSLEQIQQWAWSRQAGSCRAAQPACGTPGGEYHVCISKSSSWRTPEAGTDKQRVQQCPRHTT